MRYRLEDRLRYQNRLESAIEDKEELRAFVLVDACDAQLRVQVCKLNDVPKMDKMKSKNVA